MGIKREYKEAKKATSMEVYVRLFKFEVNEVETGLILHSESNQRNEQVPKNMVAMCKNFSFALKLRSDDPKVLICVAVSGRSSVSHLDGFG